MCGRAPAGVSSSQHRSTRHTLPMPSGERHSRAAVDASCHRARTAHSKGRDLKQDDRLPHAARPLARLAVVSGLLFAPSLCAAALSEPETRVSEPVRSPRAAWDATGFRLELRIGWERLIETAPAPPLSALAVSIEPSFRLSSAFSAGFGLRYSVAQQDPWRGIRWSTTLDLTLHVTRGLSVTLGGGYGGLLTEREVDPSYYVVTVQEKHYPPPGFDRIVRCDGDGAVGLVRAGYLVALGEGFATGPVLQGDLQVTKCTGDFVDVRVAAWARSVEWWSYRTVQLGWAVTWR